MQEFHWITSNQQLQELCNGCRRHSFVVLDTEFVRVDTYYPQIGLIQLGNKDGNYLLDPLQIDDWQPFAELLADQTVIKVVHACGEDLEVFELLSGALPEPLYDSQLAAAYANLGFSWGYARLVEHFLQVELPKGVTRSDWLQRPLTDEQQLYAVQDVSYLVQLYPLLDQLLSDCTRAWLLEDCAALVAAQRHKTPDDELWQSVKLAWTLEPRQAAVLQQLTVWREQQAQRRDVPRNWVMKEPAMLELAQRCPQTRAQLEQIEGLSAGLLRHHAEALLGLIRTAETLPDGQLPERLPEPLPLEAARALKRLRKLGDRFAEEHQIARELVLRKKILVDALQSGWPSGPFTLPDALQGWRRQMLGAGLQQALEDEVR